MLIRNPHAGNHPPETYQEELLEYLSNFFDEVSIVGDGESSSACAKRACRERYDTVVCVGGDGTLDAVVTGMVEEPYRPKLCVLPGGTFNMIARMMGLPMDIVRAAKRFDFTKTAKMHVGKANDKYFSFILSTGDLAEEIHDAPREDKIRYGFLVYFANILKALPDMSLRKGRLYSPEHDFFYEGDVGHMIFILNQEYIHFQQSIFNASDPAGLLLITKDQSILTAFPVASKVLAKEIVMDTDKYSIRRLDSFVFETPEEETEFDVDGDLGGYTPIEVSVLREHMDVYIPGETKIFPFIGG